MERLTHIKEQVINAKGKIEKPAKFTLASVLALGTVLGLPGRVSAEGAVVLRSEPVSITGIDNPCTPDEQESLDLEGRLLTLETPSGIKIFRTELTTDGYRVMEMYTRKKDGVTDFRQLLISTQAPSTQNFEVDGTIDDSGNETYTTACLGANPS